MLQKELPFKEDPNLTTFNNPAFALGAIRGITNNYDGFLLENFIGIKYKIIWRTVTYKIGFCQHWKCFRSHLIFYNKYRYKFVINKIKEELLKNKYIFLYLNEKYIPNRIAYHKFNFNHDIYIIGFNDERKIFYTTGHNEKLQFIIQEISYQDLFLAIRNKTPNLYMFSLELDKTYPFSKKNPKKIKKEIKKYVFPKFFTNGINIYKFIPIFYHNRIDMRNLKILIEHFYVLQKLEFEGLDFSEVLLDAKRLFLLGIKYNTTYSQALLEEIMEQIELLKFKEILVLKSYAKKMFEPHLYNKFLKKYSNLI